MKKSLSSALIFTAAIVLMLAGATQAHGQQKPPAYPYTDTWLTTLNVNTAFPCGNPGDTETSQINKTFQQIAHFQGGGTSDWTCYLTPISITADIFSPVSSFIIIYLPENAVTVNADATIPNNFMICAGPGSSIAAGVGFTLMNHAQPCFGGGGGGSGTLTSVILREGTNITLTGVCNSTTSIDCTINASGGAGSPHPPQFSVQFNNPLGSFDGSADFTTSDTGQVDINSGGTLKIEGALSPGDNYSFQQGPEMLIVSQSANMTGFISTEGLSTYVDDSEAPPQTSGALAVTNVTVSSGTLTVAAVGADTLFTNPGQIAYFTGLATATFLNGKRVIVTNITPGGFTCVYTIFSDYHSSAETGLEEIRPANSQYSVLALGAPTTRGTFSN